MKDGAQTRGPRGPGTAGQIPAGINLVPGPAANPWGLRGAPARPAGIWVTGSVNSSLAGEARPAGSSCLLAAPAKPRSAAMPRSLNPARTSGAAAGLSPRNCPSGINSGGGAPAAQTGRAAAEERAGKSPGCPRGAAGTERDPEPGWGLSRAGLALPRLPAPNSLALLCPQVLREDESRGADPRLALPDG